MTGMQARYDRRAAAYARCWGPVLLPAAIAALDLVADEAAVPGARLLDVGTGTGALALAAAERFPTVRVTGLDLSEAMLAQARAAAASLPAAAQARLDFVRADIGAPEPGVVPAASFDVAVSSFVLQLPADRPAALAAIRAALRPGGLLAFVTWAGRNEMSVPEAAFERALTDACEAAGVEPPVIAEPPRAGPFPSADAAAQELRAAGFEQAAVRPAELIHAYGRADLRAQLLEYDNAASCALLDTAVLADLVRRLDATLDALPDAAFTWRAPLVVGTARRPG